MVSGYPSQPQGSEQRPIVIDLRPILSPIRDQGDRPTCVAFAVTAAHELIRASGGVHEDLAEEVLYWGCKQVDADTIPGTTLPSANQALRQWGQPPEAYWPYDAKRDEATSSYAPPPEALDPQVCLKGGLKQIPATIATIRETLIRHRAVILVLPLSVPFFQPVNGEIAVPNSSEFVNERHAVLVVGYDEYQGEQNGKLILRNSWGDEWGDNGYGYLPYEYLQRYGGECWILLAL